ncbi:MAG: DinB family protein [Acidobacteriota bacterium]
MSIEALIETWKDVREGVIAETRRFDGKMVTKLALLQFSYSHEMYHRGQLTVYQRLLNIEPALTTRLNQVFEARG